MIPAYARFLPEPLRLALLEDAEHVDEVPGLRVARGLQARFPTIETVEALEFMVEVYRAVAPALSRVLEQRVHDRAFIDRVTAEAVEHNRDLPFLSPQYRTAIGAEDAAGRVVVGPTRHPVTVSPVQIPPFLEGEQVTLFGPPDTARMSINAMNALHRRRPDEPALVAELVEASGQVPRWGADDEDSKTPIMDTFLRACENLGGCFDGTITAEDPRGTRRLAERGLSLPIKRFPGLALPDGNHLYEGHPLPLHLVDFLFHLFHHRSRPEALVFYVPKLENEEEAAYMRALIVAAERSLNLRFPSCAPDRVRVLVVFENPRAIFRIAAMAAALGPSFLGGSLGWHDFLASTARLFRHDPRYRIPVKADPDIVITRIAASHRILVSELTPFGALRIGGMYGVLFEDGDPDSFRVSMIGFIRDVITQMKRGLDGYWVAHPDFVRIGIALVEAWRRHHGDPGDHHLEDLVRALVPDPDDHGPLLRFVFGPDIVGLDPHDPNYPRAVLAADLETSTVIANDHPDEVRYNVFQALQYLADWLSGNGCVALPATMTDRRGKKVPVRIMDDLATTERSRWELWAEVHHGRVSRAEFETILSEELDYLRNDQPGERRIAVRWTGEAARWYPIAGRVLRQLVLRDDPPEFVPELILPFTYTRVRQAADPWALVKQLCPGRYDDPAGAH